MWGKVEYIYVRHHGDNNIKEKQTDVITIYNNVTLHYDIIALLYLTYLQKSVIA